MNILEVIGRAATDPVHASLCMALYHTGTALARHMPSTVQEPLLRYTAQFQIHSKQEFNEEENLGSQKAQDTLAEKMMAYMAGATEVATGTMQMEEPTVETTTAGTS